MRKAHSFMHQLIEPFQPSFAEGHDSVEEKSRLLIRLRWCVILTQVLLIYPAVHLEYLVSDKIIFYLAVVGILALFNFYLQRRALGLSLFTQLSVDLLALCSLLILTAGCHNPFSSLLFVGAILGPMFLRSRQALTYLLASAIGLSIVCFYTEPVLVNASGHEVSSIMTIAAKIIVLFMLGSLTLWLKACLEQSHRRYEKLYKQKQRLNNFRAIGVVAGQLSHELSTPLNTLKIMMDKFGRNEALAQSSELRVARSALGQCEQTIRDLFDSGVNADALSFKDTQVAEFIRSICIKWQLDFPEAQLIFDIEDEVDQTPYRLPATPFAQAVLDILDNAKEASDKDSLEISIGIKALPEGINILISDRGRGLDETIIDRIGEPFVSTKSTGTGLGVYNASALLEALGGTLGLGARRGGGTQVLMVLPL